MENRCTIETATDLSIDENLSSAALRLSSIFPTAPRSPSSTSPDVDPEQGSPGSATHHSTDLDEIRRELADLKTSHVALMDRCAAIEVENGILRDKVFALQSNKSIQVTQLSDEMGEKRKREKNVILSGLPETRKRTPRSRGADDRATALRALVTFRPETTMDDLHQVTRLGKKLRGRTRPMKVTPMKGTGGTPGYRRNPHHSLHTRRTQDRPPAPGKRQAAAVTVNFSFLYTNVASLMSKFSQLLVEVDSKAPTVIVITETWLHDRIPDSYVNIPGYNLFRRFRPDDPHGGVPIYVLNSISGMNIATAPLTQLMEPSLEAL